MFSLVDTGCINNPRHMFPGLIVWDGIQRKFGPHVHTNETLHPISRACVLGVIQKCRHISHNCDIYCYKIVGSIVSSVTKGEGAGKNCHFMRDVIFE